MPPTPPTAASHHPCHNQHAHPYLQDAGEGHDAGGAVWGKEQVHLLAMQAKGGVHLHRGTGRRRREEGAQQVDSRG
jgi:hypothetical protein